MTSSLDLSGRVALVTGASGGIGGALARRLAESGVDLALTYAGNPDDAEAVAVTARELGRRASVLRADMTDPAMPPELIDRVEADLGPIDVLVPAAGTAEHTDWSDVDLELWDRTMAVNVRAPWALAQRVLPGMVERGFGRLMFVSSVAALNGGVIGPHYAASKAALHGLMHHLAPRVAGSGVTVTSLAPALVGGTRMMPGEPDGLPMAVPVGRPGTVEEQADFALAALRNGYLTDKVLTLDGGVYPS